jgi:hypothetical protein
MIPLYHLYLYIQYTTDVSCGGIQLISTIGSFRTGPFETVVYGGIVHRKKLINTF